MSALARSLHRLTGGIVLAATLALPALAQTAAGAFSATAVQSMPDGSIQTGKIMKSGQNMRLEMEVNGQRSIQIMRGAEGVAYLIDPGQQIYAEIRDPSIAEAVDGAPTPCPASEQMQAAQLSCEHVGEGLISGITTQKWELRNPQDTNPTIIEWDTGRRRALAQTWPDGTSLVLTFQAMQEVSGRQVEYWSTSLQAPGQAAALGGWWFDPELRVVVREQIPGGISRELQDITLAPIDPGNFLPPAGYQAVEPQVMAPQPSQGGQ